MKHFEWLCREIDATLTQSGQEMTPIERQELRLRMKDLSRRAALHLRDSIKIMSTWTKNNPE